MGYFNWLLANQDYLAARVKTTVSQRSHAGPLAV